MTHAHATLAEIESLFSDTMEKVADTNGQISEIKEVLRALPEMNAMMKAMVNTQTLISNSQVVMAEAASSMAKTFEKSEKRQEQLETNNAKLYEHKGVSNGVFSMVVGTLLLVIVALVIWGTGLNLKGSFTNLEISQQRNTKELKNSIEHSAEEVIQEVQKDPKGENQ